MSENSDETSETFKLGQKVAGGEVAVVHTHECARGHEVRGAMGTIACPWCAVRRAERAEEVLKKIQRESPDSESWSRSQAREFFAAKERDI